MSKYSCSSAWPAIPLILGIIVGSQTGRLVHPAPAYSDLLGRASYHISFRNNYFAGLKSFEEKVDKVIEQGRVPLIVLGDSTIRGTGARTENVWTWVLQKMLDQHHGLNFKVLNFAQDGGDRVGPFMFFHLYERYPQARFVVQWQLGEKIGTRSPSHIWITDQIILDDWTKNYAVSRIEPASLTREELLWAGLAGLDMLFPYNDLFNNLRYYYAGGVERDKPFPFAFSIRPLQAALEVDQDVGVFRPNEKQLSDLAAGFCGGLTAARIAFMNEHKSDFRSFMEQQYPAKVRDRLIMLTLDYNPLCEPQSASEVARYTEMWICFRAELGRIEDLEALTMTWTDQELSNDDFIDHAHLTVQGQRKLASRVYSKVIESWRPTE
jgi:hypothetical protein